MSRITWSLVKSYVSLEVLRENLGFKPELDRDSTLYAEKATYNMEQAEVIRDAH
ncbi:hypothetical protein PIB30_103348, partial [Stylosanthes scabra]|nr:hypothetical protein [Stylosanthes scabra]